MLFFLLVLSLYQGFNLANALFNNNQTNTSVNIALHQCNNDITILRNITLPTDKIFESCNLNCCIKLHSNPYISSKTCQVTVQSLAGLCLGRLCYTGECNQFHSSINMIFNQKMKNTIFILRSSSLINLTSIAWPSWRDRSDIPIRYSILILLLIVNLFLTLITLLFVIKSIRHAQILAEKKLRRYSLF